MAEAIRDIRLHKRPHLVDKTEAKREAEKHWRAICQAVDLRDRFICRACGRKVVATLAAVPERREHHHIIPRSRGGESSTSNVLTLCARCHVGRHVTRTVLIEGDADGVLCIEFVKQPTPEPEAAQ